MHRKKITLQLLLWCTAILISLMGIFLFLQYAKKEYYAPALCLWLLLLLFFMWKIHSLFRSRLYFQKGDLDIRDLDDISGIDFEKLTCDILALNGFEVAENTQASSDFGVDVLAFRNGISFAIQCKRYNSDVGIEAVQQVYAGRAYYECHVAVVLTNQYFTDAAKKLADKIGVVLWDRDMLENLL